MGTINTIHDVIITPLLRYFDERGTVMHIMKATDPQFKAFGEVYCSSVFPGMIKGWHLHHRVTLNYVVLSGAIRFVMYDARPQSPTYGTVQEMTMGSNRYVRVTVPPGIWSAFQGISNDPALVCNLLDFPHDDSETERCSIDKNDIPYQWR